jgi:membrane protein YqaA with SNARE-associated domain
LKEARDVTELVAEPPRARPPAVPVWLWPAVMLVLTAIAFAGAHWQPSHSRLWLFLPFSFAGNSLAPPPGHTAVVYLGPLYPVWLIVLVGTIGTVIIEYWNMELLARLLSREGTRGFRGHRITGWALYWYRKAPFWTLVSTCVLPIIPHYPMRFVAVLDNYPMWKYQGSVILGRGARYALLAHLGIALKVPPVILFSLGLVFLAVMILKMRQMNRTPIEVVVPPLPVAPTPIPAETR